MEGNNIDKRVGSYPVRQLNKPLGIGKEEAELM
jgi:hypothetical protein